MDTLRQCYSRRLTTNGPIVDAGCVTVQGFLIAPQNDIFPKKMNRLLIATVCLLSSACTEYGAMGLPISNESSNFALSPACNYYFVRLFKLDTIKHKFLVF